MRQPHYTLTAAAVRLHTQSRLQKHLRFADHGPKCTAHMLWVLLLYAASRICSLAAACSCCDRAAAAAGNRAPTSPSVAVSTTKRRPVTAPPRSSAP